METKLKGRREFLKEMGVYASLTAFLASIPWLNTFAQEKGKNIAASDRVRIAII